MHGMGRKGGPVAGTGRGVRPAVPRAAPSVLAVTAVLLAVLLCGWPTLPGLPELGDGPAAASSGSAVTLPPVESPGCHAATPPVQPGEQTLPLTVAGRAGSYVEQVPPAYDGRHPLPVVFDFHGYSEPASLQVTLSALGTLGDREGFITVTPQVTEPVPLWESTVGSQDMAFVDGLFHTVERTLCVDQRRLYATGYSNGAFMSSAIACQFAGVVAAVAPVAGIQDISHCHPSRPVPVVAFHGTADPYVHFNGSPSKTAADLPAPTGSGKTLGQSPDRYLLAPAPSIPQDAADWAHRNGCGPTPARRTVARGVTLVRYPCPDGADVELYVVKGGGHAWPGSRESAEIRSVIGYTTFAVTADAVMWRFFRAHPMTARD